MAISLWDTDDLYDSDSKWDANGDSVSAWSSGSNEVADFATVPIYRQTDLIYRRDRDGVPLIYRAIWGPPAPSAEPIRQPNRRAVTLRVYDRDGVLQHILSSNAQRFELGDLGWEMLDNGCGNAQLELARDYRIEQDWRVDVHLWNSPTPCYSGFVVVLPDPGTTERTWKYEVQGGIGLLDRVYVSSTYEGQPVSAIALDLLQQVESRLPQLRVFPTDVEPTLYSTQGVLRFLRTPVKQALQQVSDLAGGYLWGVDERRRMFFRAPSQEVDYHNWVGRHLRTYVPRADYGEIVNELYVKAGKIRDDLDPSDPYHKTNWLPDQLISEQSQQDYGLRQGEYSAPSVLSLIDAAWAGGNELARVSKPRQYARVDGLIYRGTPVTAGGNARIVGRNGRQLTLPKRRLRFALAQGAVEISLELGDMERTVADRIWQLTAREAKESLARQQSQQQL